MTVEERGIHGHMLRDVDLEALVGKKMHKDNYKRIIGQGYKVCCKLLEVENDCWKKSLLLGFYYCR